VPKIEFKELQQRMAAGDLTDEEWDRYFIMTEGPAPFQPEVEINWENVEAPEDGERSALLLNGVNGASRFERRMRFFKRLADGYSGPTLVAEGDSWFQYPFRLRDVVDWMIDDEDSYPVLCTSAAGDLLANMADRREYIASLEQARAKILLVSGGGNDLCAGGALARHLERFDPELKPWEYLRSSYTALLDEAFAQYDRIFRDVLGARPGSFVICHGYDYAIPLPKGRWLGLPMAEQGIVAPKLQREIAVVMVDRFNKGLKRLASTFEHVRFVDCRGLVPADGWFDELHPRNVGFRTVSRRILEVARDILEGRREAPPPPQPVPRGRRSQPAGTVEEEQRPVRDPIGLSLHVGLNTVDPGVYSGWDGRLVACENDARAMELLARRQGFEATTLLTRAATHDAVVGAIKAAADRLWAGDTFLWTLSGHGTQLPDYNGDEAAVKSGDLMDESFCLYDGEIIDDELFSLWRSFRKGVRIAFVADTCHSGGALRKAPTFAAGLDLESIDAGRTLPIALRLAADRARQEMLPPAVRSRRMPDSVRNKVILDHEQELVDYAKKFQHVNEAILSSPLTSDLEASLLQVGGCLENQTAADGDEYGAFTAALLRVWREGQFPGDWRAFHTAIAKDMEFDSQTPVLRTWPKDDRTMLRQRPLAIWGPSRSARRAATEVALTEGNENDVAPRGPRKRGPAASKLDDATIEAFGAFLTGEGVELGGVFEPSEFLCLGSSHEAPGAVGFNKNGPPARDLWKNALPTIRLLVQLRQRLNAPISINSGYRNQAYNAAVGGEPNSVHMRFNAFDITSSKARPDQVAAALEAMAGEGLFLGGLGRYNGFTHVDTRGRKARWDLRTRRRAPRPRARQAAPAAE
jgi:hypothetical protein